MSGIVCCLGFIVLGVLVAPFDVAAAIACMIAALLSIALAWRELS